MFGRLLAPNDFYDFSQEGPAIPASLRQLLYPGDQPAYYTEEQFPDHSHLLKDYSSGVGSLREKRLGYCYDFDGTDDYVALASGSIQHDVDEAFTVTASIKVDTVSGTKTIVSTNQIGFHRGLTFAVTGSNLIIYFNHQWASNALQVATTTSPITAGVWHNVTVTYNGSTDAAGMTFYVDGVEQAKGTPAYDSLSATTLGTGTPKIGYTATLDWYMNGSVFDVRDYDRELTADEVTYLHTNGLSGTDPGTANLVAHYPLQEESGTTAYDISGNENHGTITNAVTSGVGSIHQPDAGVTKSYPNDAGYSRRMVFDGVDDYVEVTGMTAHTHYFGACTISAKVYITNLTSNQNIWALGLKAYRLLLTNLGEWSHGNNTATGVYATLGEHELSVDYDASGRAISFSVDGVEVWTGVGAGSNSGTSFFIGSGDGSSLFFKGLIWDFAITGSAVKNFAFEGYGNTDADWVDTTGGGNNGTVNGSPINTYIPAATTTLDALGGTLTETGRVPQYGTALGYGWQGNGSTVRVDIGTAQTWTLTNTWKVTIHFKLESTATTQTLLYIADGSSSITVQYRASIGFLCAFLNGSFFGPSAASLSAAADGNWHTISIEHLGSNSIVVTLDGIVVANGSPAPDTGASIGFNILSRGPGSYADASIGPVTITTGGVTTSFHPIPGTRDVAKVVSNAEGSVISNAVVNGVLADLYTIGNGSWRLPHIENGAHWDGTAIYPAGPGQANAVNGEAINIPANVAPRGLLTDRTGGVIAPLDYAMGADEATSETFDQNAAAIADTLSKRFADDNYSDRYGAGLSSLIDNSFFGTNPEFQYALVDDQGNFIVDDQGNYIIADPSPRT
jgi:hypothetical protein